MARTIAVTLAAALAALLFAARAQAQTIPPCEDAAQVTEVGTLYKFGDAQKGGLFQSLEHDIKELGTTDATSLKWHFGDTASQKVAGARYCQVTARLGNGQSDTVYYRIVHLVDGEKHTFKPEICSPRIYSFMGQCEDWRPH
jgi:hypothetical protein